MTRSFAPVLRWLPHVPWIAAVVVLVVGIVGWSARPSSESVKPAPEPIAPPVQFDEQAFRQALNLEELSDDPFAETGR
jgi:hypothetical protein